MIEIIEVNDNNRLLNDFVFLPFKLYSKKSFWVPPLISEEKKLLSKKNPFWKDNSRKLYLAKKDGKYVGRIAGIINNEHNSYHNDKVGFFGFFESINDIDVAKLLLSTASDFLKKNGLEKMRGPVNPSMNDTCGVLIYGFYQPPAFMMPYNFPYYDSLLKNSGFCKVMDLYAWYLTISATIDRLERLEQKVIKREDFTIRNFSMKNFNRDVKFIWQLYCEAWKDNWGFVPPTEEQFFYGIQDLKNIGNEKFIFFIEDKGLPVAFSAFLPDFNQVFKKQNGKLHFWQIPHFLRAVKKINSARLAVLGIKDGYKGRGLDLILYIESFKIAKEYGMAGGEMGWTLESNTKINGGIRKMGSELYKRYRLYEREL